MTFVDPELSPLTGNVQPGTSLLNAAMQLGALVRTTCGGFARCHECRVTVSAGAEALSVPQPDEEQVLGAGIHQGARLSCQARVVRDGHDVVVLIPPRRAS